MPAIANRVKETTTSTGTGNITLAGAATGYQSFNTAFGLHTLFDYVIDDGSSSWETGSGYLTGTTTLVRETVTASSNGGSLVNFASGTKSVFCDILETRVTCASHGKTLQISRSNFNF